MINTEFALFDLPFFGMTHAGHEGPIEHAPHQAGDAKDADIKFTKRQVQPQASASSRHVQLEELDTTGHAAPGGRMELAITGMTCMSCVRHVEHALKQVPSVASVSVDLAARRAHVETLGAVDPASLMAAVEEAGYTAAHVQGDASKEAGHEEIR
jgi:Cu+-exporting ATPase